MNKEAEKISVRKNPWIFFLLGVIVVLTFYGISWWFANVVPGSWEQPPLYPGAKQVSITAHKPNYYLPEVALAFETSDPPEKVLDFYRNNLLQDRWRLGRSVPDSTGLSFHWFSPQEFSPMYLLDVTVERLNSGMTKVQVIRRFLLGM
ncbi:MAG: hypothetical protein M3441_18210 [Chloroflexota bacterium]|nr:hypothetical protein [Chloroflexota bacterium]